ncbi:MAG TPA: tRNA glutamyl-Q(34) synthetase GluQRS [Alphaproteobacteria bacterium]
MLMPAPAVPVVTRFAPSPTGRLHLGHAYAALFAWRAAREAGGRFLLRIENIDATRCRPEFEAAIDEDLAWLGLDWEKPVRRQSEHFAEYAAALDSLKARELIYPCFCTRAEIRAEIARAGAAPHGNDGPVYPGTCRRLDDSERARRIAEGRPYALRLDVAKALALTGPLTWFDRERGTVPADPQSLGDVVLARKETPTSYHLSVTVDDHRQGVTLVTRGEDLFAATHIHRLLQALLGFPTPVYHHHRLVTGPGGERLAKRAGAPTLKSLREAGRTPAQVRAMVGF